MTAANLSGIVVVSLWADISVGKEKKSYFKLNPLVGKGYSKKLLSGVRATYCGTPPFSNCATCVSSLCAAAVVLFAPLVAPVNVVEDVPVYVICSLPMNIVPVESNPVVLLTVTVVAESVNAPSKFVVVISSSCVI